LHARAPASCSSALVMPAVVVQLFGQDFVLADTSKWLGHTLGRDVLLRTISDEARLHGLRASSSSALVLPAVVVQLFGQDFVLTGTSKWLGHALGRDVLINTMCDEARLRTKRKWIHLDIYVRDRDKQVDKSNKIA
jgi:uncharacterized protein YjaZ